jgi:hypothetical protein
MHHFLDDQSTTGKKHKQICNLTVLLPELYSVTINIGCVGRQDRLRSSVHTSMKLYVDP